MSSPPTSDIADSPVVTPSPARNAQQRLLESGLVLLAFCALTVALTWPLAAHFTTTLPDGNDSWKYLWNLWWAKVSLLGLHSDFYHTTYLYYPLGTNLYLDTPTPLLGAIGIPLQLLGLNLVTTYNFLMCLSFVVAGYGTYLLVKQLTNSPPSAFISGIIFAFSPYHFAHMLGHLNIASIEWIPFYILSLLKATDGTDGPDQLEDRQQATGGRWRLFLRRTQLRWAMLAGVWLAAISYTEWTYALFMLIFTLWLVIWQLARRRSWWRERILTVGAAIVVWLILVAPVLVPMVGEASAESYGRSTLNDAAYFGSDVTDAFVPSLFHPLWSTLNIPMNDRWLTKPRTEKVVYVGYSVLAIAVVSAILLRRQKQVLFWAWTALGAWVLSLGPVVYVWGQHIFFGLRIPLPYVVLYFLPFFDIMRVPSRFTVLVMLGLAVLVGYALAHFLAASPAPTRYKVFEGRRARAVAWLAVGAVIIFEFLAVPYPMQSLDYNEPIYSEIAQQNGQFAVLDLPLTPTSIYDGYQTISGKPMVSGYLSRQPDDPFVENTPVLKYLLPSTTLDDPASALAGREGLAELRAVNIRYVIVHDWNFMAGTNDEKALLAKTRLVFSKVNPRVEKGNQATLIIYDLSQSEMRNEK